MSFTSRIGLLHLVSDWLRITDQERDDFLALPPLKRLRFLRERYLLEKDELQLVVREMRAKIAQTVMEVLQDEKLNPERPGPWGGASMFHGPMTAGGSKGPKGPGWGGPQWSCIESVHPQEIPAGKGTPVTVTGWIFDDTRHKILFKTKNTYVQWIPSVEVDPIGTFVAKGDLTLAAGTYSVSITTMNDDPIADNILPDAIVVT